MPDQTFRDRLERRSEAMYQELSSFLDHYRLLSEFIRPRSGRFETTDRNKGDRRHDNIINSRATKALQVATAGMVNGTMPPTRVWSVPEITEDPDLNNFGPVRQWLWIVQERMRRILNSSNFYGMMPITITEQLLFGTGCVSHVNDPLELARFYAHTVGSYAIAQDDRFKVNSVARSFEMTVEQIVGQFSPDPREISKNISPFVRNAYDRGNYDTWVPVKQLTQPNYRFVQDSPLSKRFAFSQHYWEPGNADRDAFLDESGFKEFPFYCPRWELTGEDVYATNCPGMQALGDVLQLQLQERKKAQGLEKMVTPVMQGPASLRNARIKHNPGFTIAFDAGGDQNGLRPAYQVNLPLGELTLDMDRVQQRIDEAFFVDLFKAITAMQGVQPRNELELIQRDQERLTELVPVLQRVYDDLLEPMFDRLFNQMVRADAIPPAPPEIAGKEIKPRFVSTLALAQQASVTGNIDRMLSVVERIGSLKPAAMDKFNFDATVEEYAKLIGLPPKLIVDDRIVASGRQAQAAAAQQQQQMQTGQVLAGIGKTMSETDLGEENVLSQVVDGINQRAGR